MGPCVISIATPNDLGRGADAGNQPIAQLLDPRAAMRNGPSTLREHRPGKPGGSGSPSRCPQTIQSLPPCSGPLSHHSHPGRRNERHPCTGARSATSHGTSAAADLPRRWSSPRAQNTGILGRLPVEIGSRVSPGEKLRQLSAPSAECRTRRRPHATPPPRKSGIYRTTKLAISVIYVRYPVRVGWLIEFAPDLYGAFSVKRLFWVCCQFFVRSGKAVLRPVAWRSGSRSARKGSRDRNGSKAWRLAA
jgi:hypothetical protein